MLLTNKLPIVVGLLAGLFFGFWWFSLQPTSAEAHAQKCEETHESEVKKIDCWYEGIRAVFDAEGTAGAFEHFEHIYGAYPAFSNTGCHRHAHRVGDMSYYFDYLTHQDLEQMSFPKGATACGYGFYHGFIEHLVQDNPDAQYVTQACTFMKKEMSDVAPAISQTCYHGAGHGFLLAQADIALTKDEWNTDSFIQEPLNFCESLTSATDHEISECRQGVFNVMIDWMITGEFGLEYNHAKPFEVCEIARGEQQVDCYREAAQKLDSASEFDPRNMAALIGTEVSEDVQKISMTTGVAGLVQHDPQNDQRELLVKCKEIETPLLKQSCIMGILGGLVEHTVPGTGYASAIAYCEYPELNQEEKTRCNAELVVKLERFHTNKELQHLCEKGTLSSESCSYVDTASAK